MVKKAILLLSAAATLAGSAANAQKVCGSDEANNAYKAAHPEVAYYENLMNEQIQQKLKDIDLKKYARTTGATDDTLYDVPLVFHIVHDYGSEYMTDNDVFVALNDINRYYGKINPDTTDVIAPYKGFIPGTVARYIGKSHIQFHLATKDPSGNPTHGITRHRSYLTYNGGDWAKYDQWSPKNYINIWTVKAMPSQSNAAAYAYQPPAAAADPYIDGVIALYNYVATGGNVSYQATLAHELGHTLNLAHPWGNTNNPEVACGDDAVDDTPPTKGHLTEGCVPLTLYDTACINTNETIEKDSFLVQYTPVRDTLIGRSIDFIAYDTFTLRSVNIYPSDSLNSPFKIVLKKNGAVVDSFSGVTTVAIGNAQTVPLNFVVLKDLVNQYSLSFAKNPGTYHDSVFATYSKSRANTVTIMNDVTGGLYNYFYNWKVVNAPDSGFIGKAAINVMPDTQTHVGITFSNPTRFVIKSVNIYSADTVGASYQVILEKKSGAGAYATVNTYTGTIHHPGKADTAKVNFVLPASPKTDTFRISFGHNPRAMRDSSTVSPVYTSSIPGAVQIFKDLDATGTKYNYFYDWSVQYGYFKFYTASQMALLYDSTEYRMVDTFSNNVFLVDYPDTVNAQNIMDYTYCSRMFSHGQVVRMRTALTGSVAYRDSLYTPFNLNATGALQPRPDLTPIADFSLIRVNSGGSLTDKIPADRVYGCADGNVSFTFYNQSWNDTIVSQQWTFGNGALLPSPTTSTVVNKFTQPGWVSVKLDVTGNNTGVGTVTRNAIYVADTTPLNPDAFWQDFTPGTTDKWPIFNYFNNDTKWELVSNAGYYDNYSIRYKNFDARTGAQNEGVGTPQGDYDDFFTPGFDLTSSEYATNCNFTFWSSGAFRTNNPADMKDSLEIWYSIDCGNTWRNLAYFSKGQLSNVGVATTDFTPSSYTQWKLQGVAIPAIAKSRKTFFRIRYRPGAFASLIGSGNNFYMDRINISQFPLGVNEAQLTQEGMVLAPNPTTGSTSVVLKGGEGKATIQVTDITGKVVYTTQAQMSGEYTRVEIPAYSISVKGIYLVHAVTDSKTQTQKLVVY